VLRGIIAILLGVGGAASINAFIIAVAVRADGATSSGWLAGLAFIAVVGAIITAPAWMLWCLVLLPVVTHRSRRGMTVTLRNFQVIGAGLGATLTLGLMTFYGALPDALPIFALCGAVGGVSLATAWNQLVLARTVHGRAKPHGATLG
jgi:hypothetical protein